MAIRMSFLALLCAALVAVMLAASLLRTFHEQLVASEATAA